MSEIATAAEAKFAGPGPHVKRSAKALARSLHGIAGRSPAIARGYLALFRVAKWFPDGTWKEYLLNSLQSVEWPVGALRPTRVELGNSVVVSVVPHPGEFDFAAHLYRRLRYEPEVLSWLKSRAYDIVVEIGANVGVYTLLFSMLWPNSRIYSFEPSRAAYARLLENLSLNGCPNVVPFNCAVASEAGLLDFHEPRGHLTNGSLDLSFASLFAECVASTKVVSLSGSQITELISGGAKRILLKIDVEGAEASVLQSLEHLIVSRHPDIVIEVLPRTAEALNRIQWLRSYRFYQLDHAGAHERDYFIAGQHRDYALLPSSRD